MEGPHNHGIVASIPMLLAISSYDLTCHIMLSDSKVWIPIYWSLPTLAGCPSAYRQFQIPCKNGTQFLLKQFLWHKNGIPWNHRVWMMKCTNGLHSWAVVKPLCDSTKYWLIKSGFPSSRIVRIPKIWDGYWYWIVPHWSSTYHHPMILYLRISQYLLIPVGSNSTWSWFSKPPKSSSTNQRLPPQLRKGLALVVLPRDHGPHAGQGHEELRTFALGGGQGINGPTRKYSKVVYKSKWAGVYVITILWWVYHVSKPMAYLGATLSGSRKWVCVDFQGAMIEPRDMGIPQTQIGVKMIE